MYEYQKELIYNLQDSIQKINKMTDKRYYFKIGKCHFRDKRESLGEFNVYGVINGRSIFNIDDSWSEFGDDYGTEIISQTQYYFKFDDNIFIKLNNIIDKIKKDNKERKEKYEKINNELEKLNKTLEV